uniref:hypothetical protein n=1 Tax=Scandinavium goeteborgense TaxID=1851514 RepID=UPI00135C413A|nr:hypothetical protein [Scandinavium goeteborgense]
MLKFAKYTALAIYGFVGIFGWYEYESLHQRLDKPATIDNISPDMTINYVRAMVWYHSRGKLQELRSILMNDDLKQKERIEIRIKNMLQHRSSAYIREFNSLHAPVKNLGNWYQDNFDFNNFLQDVYLIVFEEKLNVDEKIRNITDVMEEYQNITSRKLIEKLTQDGVYHE